MLRRRMLAGLAWLPAWLLPCLSAVFLACLSACLLASAARAVEGPTAAGPIGGTDRKSAFVPPPGLYGGTVQAYAATIDFLGGDGRPVQALGEAHLEKPVAAPFFYYVPDVQVLGGSVGFGAILPFGGLCGRLAAGMASRCKAGLGDLYAEGNWGRFFGTMRPSTDPGAYPIAEGLAMMVGFGTVFPTGAFSASSPLNQALSIGNNTWDFAPSLAATYTTAPLLAEGTEFSAKFYWNNYLRNPQTGYRAGDLLVLDFAVTEHVGRVQIGPAGVYAVQVEDDRLRGLPVAPDGRRGTLLQMGAVLGYDLPEQAASLKLKALTTVFAANTVSSWSVVAGWVKRF